MKHILIVYTGGTIGMVPSASGYSPRSGVFRAALDGIGDMHHPNMPSWDFVEMDPILDSSDIAVEEWNKIGSLIAQSYERYDGFVVMHGTDTMAYTASALSFMLENLAKPVVLTGSQIPLCELRSDGRDNLVTSMLIAAEGKVSGVSLYFGGRLLRGNRAVKYSADGMIAFTSPNSPPLAEAGIATRYFETEIRPLPTGAFHLQELKNVPIGVIKAFPGIQFELFERIATESLKGIVLETFGAGNIPSSGGTLLSIVEKAMRSGAIVVVCSQCLQGTVTLGAYEASSALKRAGAVSGHDLTTEAAVAKLYYLFSKGLGVDEIKVLMERDLSGELTCACPCPSGREAFLTVSSCMPYNNLRGE